MVSNVFTKNEILEGLASKGHFIDSFTLDSFFEQWEIEAIYEDEEGQEFFDKSTLDFVCEKLFNNTQSEETAQNDTSLETSENDSETEINQTELNQETEINQQAPQNEETEQEELSIDNNSEEISIDDNAEEMILEEEPSINQEQIQPSNEESPLTFSGVGLVNIRDVKFQDEPRQNVKYSNQQEEFSQTKEENINNTAPESSQQENEFAIPNVENNNYNEQISNNRQNAINFNQQPQNFKPTPNQYYEQAIQPQIQPQQPQIQPQIMPQINPQQFQNNANQMPYNIQQQYQNPQFNTPQPQQPFNQYNQFQNNAFPNPQMPQQNIQQNEWGQTNFAPKPNLANEFSINDPEISKILNGVQLSNGNSLMNKLKSETGLKDYSKQSSLNPSSINNIPNISNDDILKPLPSEKQNTNKGLLEGAMAAAGMSEKDLIQNDKDIDMQEMETPDFDDISLLSESMEAQEKFRQYVVSELAKKNVDLTPQGNEFKLDISERTINMIARTVAKKIAKNVTAILTNEAKNSAPAKFKEEHEKLIKVAKALEEENKRLKLINAECEKQLRSYVPSKLFRIFGLYKKVKTPSKLKARVNPKVGLNARNGASSGSKTNNKK